MLKVQLAIYVLLFSGLSFAQTGKTDFEIAMEQNAMEKTSESDVTIGGIHYHRIEYKNQNYYLKFSKIDQSQQDLDVICRDSGFLPSQGEPKLEGQIKITRRSSFFISALEDGCKGKQSTVVPVVKLGIKFADNQKDILKNKSVFFNLLTQQLGFGADW
jgi:hypothetical protein